MNQQIFYRCLVELCPSLRQVLSLPPEYRDYLQEHRHHGQFSNTFIILFRQEIHETPLVRMQEKRMAFLDTLILNLAERLSEAETFVTWNARHFRDKSSLTVLTPAEYLE